MLDKQKMFTKVRTALGIDSEKAKAQQDLQVWNNTVSQKAMGQIIPDEEYETRRVAGVKAHNFLRKLEGKPPRDNRYSL